jgi:hypothetical protein
MRCSAFVQLRPEGAPSFAPSISHHCGQATRARRNFDNPNCRGYTASPTDWSPIAHPRPRLTSSVSEVPPDQQGSLLKPRVLYVLGYGRSGSTMLGMALGQHSHIVNLGEISALRRFVPGPTYRAPRACGCLLQLDQCPYWTGVARRLGSLEKLARTGIAISPTMGWRRYAPWLPEPSDELPQWAEATAALYRATLDEANAALAVDTSKGAARGWWLWKSGAIDLHFIWLTRRLEDVLRSQIRHGQSAIKTALSWRLAQRQAAQITRQVENAGVRVPRISYERLTEDPRAVLSRILEHVELPWQEDVLTPRPDHVIGGDHAVKHGGRHVIEPSSGPRSPLPLRARLTLKLLDDSGPGEPISRSSIRDAGPGTPPPTL